MDAGRELCVHLNLLCMLWSVGSRYAVNSGGCVLLARAQECAGWVGIDMLGMCVWMEGEGGGACIKKLCRTTIS